MTSSQPSALHPTAGIVPAALRLYWTSLFNCLPWSLALAVILTLLFRLIEVGIAPLQVAVENRIQIALLSEDSGDILNEVMQAEEQSRRLLNSPDIVMARGQMSAYFSAARFWAPCALCLLLCVGCWNALLLSINATGRSVRPHWMELLSGALQTMPRACLLWLLIAAASIVGLLPAIASGALLISALLLLAALALYLTAPLMLAWVPVVTGPVGVWNSIRECHRLIKGHWWRSITLLSVVLFVPTLLAFLALAIEGVALMVIGVGDRAIASCESLTRFAAFVAFQPLIPSLFVALYRELRQLTRAMEAHS